MAGDWIKVEKATARKPEVLRLAELLSIHPDQAFGLCFRFWSWCDDHLADGKARSVTRVTVDNAVDRPGFADALVEVGWLRDRNSSLEVPNFDRHISQSAKSRTLTAQRVATHKKRKGNAQTVTSALPKEEKRREEKIETKDTFLSEGCSEAAKSPPSEPPVLTFQCVKGESWSLPQKQVDAWSVAYPAVDVLSECRKAHAWIEANSAKRKTRGGMPAFLNRWLANEQNRGGTFPSRIPATGPPSHDGDRQGEIERRRAAQRERLGLAGGGDDRS